MLRKVTTIAAVLVLLTLLATPWILAQQEDTSMAPSGSPATVPFIPPSEGTANTNAGFLQYGGSTGNASSACEFAPTELSSPENPYASNAATPFDHVPGEFIVSYASEEAMWAGPQENVVDTSLTYGPGAPFLQLLRFDDIASIPDPCQRFAAEEAKRQEILTWPGVEYAEYNSIGHLD